jgi:hypothetical protein
MLVDGGSVPDQCIQCQHQLEIASVSFPFLKPCRALFVCTSCGQTFLENGEGPKQKGGWLRRLKLYKMWIQKRKKDHVPP